MLHCRRHGDHFFFDKLPHGAENQLLLFVQSFHADSPGMAHAPDRMSASISTPVYPASCRMDLPCSPTPGGGPWGVGGVSDSPIGRRGSLIDCSPVKSIC